MKLYAFSCGLLRSRKNVYVPNMNKNEIIEAPMPVFLITHPRGNVLFDTGPHPDVFKDASARWGGIAKAMQPIGDEDSGVIAQLSRINLRPADITYVINSHFHCDHVGGNQFFSQSTFIVQKKEMESARSGKYDQSGYMRADWDHPLKYVEIDGEMDMFNDGRLILIPLPGHTPGHQIMLVRLEKDGSLILSGDIVPCIENYALLRPSRANVDDEEASNSIRKLHELVQNEKAFLFHGHDPHQWEKIRKAPEYYY